MRGSSGGIDRRGPREAADFRMAAPGPIGLPVLGHSVAFARDKPGFLMRCQRRHGDTVRLWIAGPTVLLAAPEDVRHVLVSGAGDYGKSSRVVGRRARDLLGFNVVTAEGQDHARLRRELSLIHI